VGLNLRNVVVNLEGALVSEDGRKRRRRERKVFSLYSAPEVLATLKSWDVRVACLANNHVTDFDVMPSETVLALAKHGIVSCGAGDNWGEAAEPACVVIDGRRAVFLAFGWPTIECLVAGRGRPGVNPLWPQHVLNSVRAARSEWPAAALVVLMHWNFETERYPMPMHRQLAFDVVEAGADAVVGHHPHCAQGIEFFGGAPVVYSLGNWFLPQGRWFGGVMRYPEYVLDQLAFEWRPGTGASVCHWFRYDPGSHDVVYRQSAPAQEDAMVSELTPFAGMSHADYVKWFRENRYKSKALPVYADYRRRIRNWGFDRWVSLRQRVIVMLRRRRLASES
jgi:poly-gamma-glutamate synthesis protein (capsule biosynthesis protein)